MLLSLTDIVILFGLAGAVKRWSNTGQVMVAIYPRRQVVLLGLYNGQVCSRPPHAMMMMTR